MALDELHARRLATVANIVESALSRIELLLPSLEFPGERTSHRLATEHLRQARETMRIIQRRLQAALEHFAVRPQKPEPRQALAAELSTLWVVLENARPERMKGYGREFSADDKADWGKLIEDLLRDLEEFRVITLAGKLPAMPTGRTHRS